MQKSMEDHNWKLSENGLAVKIMCLLPNQYVFTRFHKLSRQSESKIKISLANP